MRRALVRHHARIPALLGLAAIILLAPASCRYGLDELFCRDSPVDERVLDTSIPAPAAPAIAPPYNYVFIATSDLHFEAQGDPPAAAGFASLVAARGASFVVVAGDLADAGLPGEYARYAAWAASLGVPVYAAVGNHDLYNSGWASFRATVGRSFYSFSVGALSFYVLDSGNGTLGRTQLALLRSAFAADPNRKVVICHYPLYNGEDTGVLQADKRRREGCPDRAVHGGGGRASPRGPQPCHPAHPDRGDGRVAVLESHGPRG